MGKGKHKGAPRRFTNFAAEERAAEKAKKEQEWRRKRGELDSDEEEGSGDEKKEKDKDQGSASESESESGSESEEEEEVKAKKPKGVAGIIEFENPNRAIKAPKKIKDIEISKSKGPDLSRRQKEELARQNYQAAHAAGKTEQARADMERLAIIRKRREEAEAKKKEAAESASAAAAAGGARSKK